MLWRQNHNTVLEWRRQQLKFDARGLGATPCSPRPTTPTVPVDTMIRYSLSHTTLISKFLPLFPFTSNIFFLSICVNFKLTQYHALAFVFVSIAFDLIALPKPSHDHSEINWSICKLGCVQPCSSNFSIVICYSCRLKILVSFKLVLVLVWFHYVEAHFRGK